MEEEWENELAENIQRFCANGADATAIIVDGTAVRKHEGLVLISGSYNYMKGSTSTEIYNYVNNSVLKGPDMKIARTFHTSVTLPTGDVAVFGGFNDKIKTLSSYEVFNVTSKSFSEIGNADEKRQRPAAVTLPNGLVLIIGGAYGDDYDSKWLNTCEFFNPLCNTFSPSKAKMTVGRYAHTASLLPDGKVIVCGGSHGSCLQTTEIYDPSTDSFSDGPLMTVKRRYHTATTLEDGRILLTGGEAGWYYTSTEFYDPATNSFTAGPNMGLARIAHFSALLPDGSVFIGGGDNVRSSRTTEMYDPITNSFRRRINLLEERYNASASPF
jgi:hypothetical protein